MGRRSAPRPRRSPGVADAELHVRPELATGEAVELGVLVPGDAHAEAAGEQAGDPVRGDEVVAELAREAEPTEGRGALEVLPADGQLESFVYDTRDYRLTAKLDHNNFANLFSYDEEARLYLERKETVRGIMTAREVRMHEREVP